MKRECVVRGHAFVLVVGMYCFCDWARALGTPGGAPPLEGWGERATGKKQRRRVSKEVLKG